MVNSPHIRIRSITKKKLDKIKLVNDETYDSIITRLLKQVEK